MGSLYTVISTRVNGIPELVKDEVNGLLVKDHDPEELARKIEFLIEHPVVCKLYGLSGRVLMGEIFDITKISKDLEIFFMFTESEMAKLVNDNSKQLRHTQFVI